MRAILPVAFGFLVCLSLPAACSSFDGAPPIEEGDASAAGDGSPPVTGNPKDAATGRDGATATDSATDASTWSPKELA